MDGWLVGARGEGRGAGCLFVLSFLPLSGRSQLDYGCGTARRGCGEVIGGGSGVDCFEGRGGLRGVLYIAFLGCF